MKTYQITIHIEEVKKTSSYMSKILAEVEQEKREIKIAKDLNTAAGQIRKKYFQELLEIINDEFNDLGLREFKIEHLNLGSNDMYYMSSSPVWIGSEYVTLFLEPHHDKGAGYPTRYVTSTQNFSILVKKGKGEKSRLKSEDVLGDFFCRIESNIKAHLHNN